MSSPLPSGELVRGSSGNLRAVRRKAVWREISASSTMAAAAARAARASASPTRPPTTRPTRSEKKAKREARRTRLSSNSSRLRLSSLALWTKKRTLMSRPARAWVGCLQRQCMCKRWGWDLETERGQLEDEDGAFALAPAQ